MSSLSSHVDDTSEAVEGDVGLVGVFSETKNVGNEALARSWIGTAERKQKRMSAEVLQTAERTLKL